MGTALPGSARRLTECQTSLLASTLRPGPPRRELPVQTLHQLPTVSRRAIWRQAAGTARRSAGRATAASSAGSARRCASERCPDKPIVRALTVSSRDQLCDEQKPSCGACSRLLLTCEWEDKMQAALERRRKRIERLQQKERIKQEEEEKSRELQADAGPAGNADPMLGVAAWPYGAAALGWPPAMIPSWPSAGADFGILRASPGLSTPERLLTPTLRSLQPRTAVAHAPTTHLLRLTSRSSRVYCMDAVSRFVRADGVRTCGDERGDGLARRSPSQRRGIPPAARSCARNPPSDRPVRPKSCRRPTSGHAARC